MALVTVIRVSGVHVLPCVSHMLNLYRGGINETM